MNSANKKNFYEILDVTPKSTREEIEDSYRRVKEIYDYDSAAYSLYSFEEKKKMQELIKEAYETLKDPVKKSAYDTRVVTAVKTEGTSEIDISSLYPSGRSYGVGVQSERAYARAEFTKKLPISTEDELMIKEQYRILCSRLEQISLKNYFKVFAVTSAIKGEGKSITSLCTAYVMAKEFKKKTILVECDLRKPSTAMEFIGQNAPNKTCGLSDVLKGARDAGSCIISVEDIGLYVLPSGAITKSSPELLGSPELRALISTLKLEFDFIVIDSPPVLPLVDMNIISAICDGVVMVVRAGMTPKKLVEHAMATIPESKFAGIVLNGAEMKLKKYYY